MITFTKMVRVQYSLEQDSDDRLVTWVTVSAQRKQQREAHNSADTCHDCCEFLQIKVENKGHFNTFRVM